MTMPDYPPGEWSPLLVGPQWVSGMTLTIITNALANRRAIVTNFSNLHETLQSALNTTLAGQEGATADAIRDAFRQGADQAFQIAEKTEAYAKVLQKAHNDVIVLRHLLTGIAESGNKRIHDALSSKADFATKVAKISEVIADCQRQANQRAAACAEDIMNAGGEVFAAQGNGQSFRGLAHANGLDDVNRQPDLNAIEDQVRGKLGQPVGQSLMGDTPLAAPGAPSGSGPMAAGGADGGAPARGGNTVPGAPAPAAPAPAGPAPARGGNAVPGAPAPAASAAGGSAPQLAAPGLPASPQMPTSSMPAAPSAPTTGMPAGWAPANPTNVASAANTGVPAGAPTTAGAAGLPAGPVQAMEPPPPTAPTFPAAGTGTPVTVGDV
ncbi:MAG: hypothetical protein ACRDTK_12645, partial [Mycobacterium sp.]